MRLFVSDIDDTLAEMGGTELDPIIIDTINKILEQGDAFCLASGRTFYGIKNYLDMFGPGKKFAICGNGAATFDYDHNLINEATITLKDFYYFHDRFYNPDICFYAYDDKNNLFIFKKDEYVDIECRVNDIKNLLDVNDRSKYDLNSKVYKVMLACDESINKNLKLNDEESKKFSSSRSASYYFEILKKDATKGDQVEALRKYLGIDEKDVFTFGDNTNDLTMIERFNGVAVENAVNEVKAKAKYITKSVIEHGFVYAIYDILQVLKK